MSILTFKPVNGGSFRATLDETFGSRIGGVLYELHECSIQDTTPVTFRLSKEFEDLNLLLLSVSLFSEKSLEYAFHWRLTDSNGKNLVVATHKQIFEGKTIPASIDDFSVAGEDAYTLKVVVPATITVT